METPSSMPPPRARMLARLLAYFLAAFLIAVLDECVRPMVVDGDAQPVQASTQP